MVMPIPRKKRLAVVLFVAVFSTLGVGLVVYAMRGNLNHFYSPAEVVAGEAPVDRQIRVGGYVVRGSVQRAGGGLDITFRLTDGQHEVVVVYTGILPDLFAEGEAAIAKGKLDVQGQLRANEVLAKHDENYTPPEILQTAEQPH